MALSNSIGLTPVLSRGIGDTSGCPRLLGSQEALAAQAGLDRSYISELEKAGRNISLDVLEKLAQAFGIDIPELLADPEPSNLGEHLIEQIRRAITNRHRVREEPAIYA